MASLAEDIETIRGWYRESNDPLPPPLLRVLTALDSMDKIRFGLWALCPHDGKYGDDGEMQCRGADFRRAPLRDLLDHLVKSLQACSSEQRAALETAQRERDDYRARAIERAREIEGLRDASVRLAERAEKAEQEVAEAMALVMSHEGHIAGLEKQEADQRAEAKRLAALVQEYEPYRGEVAALRRALDAAVQVAGTGHDLLKGFDARRQLDAGFGGMGHNIVIETAGKFTSITYWERLRRQLAAFEAVRARVAPSAGEAENVLGRAQEEGE